MRLNLNLVQIDISEDREGNLKRALSHIKGTILQGDFFILPELFITDYESIHKNYISDYSDPFFEEFVSLSERYPYKYFLTGSIPFMKEGKLYNASFLFKGGKIFHIYDKIHLFSPMGEREIFTGGGKISIGRIRGKNFDLKIGIIICYDLRFPELVRILAKSGIDLLFVPAQWPLNRIEAFKHLIFARAVENGIFVVGVNRVGVSGNVLFGGNSLVVSPSGERLNPIYFDERVIQVSISPLKYRSYRENINPLRDVEDEIYSLKSKVKILERKIW